MSGEMKAEPPKCHHCDRSWPTEEEARLRAEVERERAVAAAERALRVAVAGEGEVFEKTQGSVRALIVDRPDAAALARAVDEAVAALRVLGVEP